MNEWAIPDLYYYELRHVDSLLFNIIYNAIYNTENMCVAYSVYLHSLSRYSAVQLSSVLPRPIHFFHLHHIVFIDVGMLPSLRPISFSIGAFFTVSHFPLCFSLELFIIFYFLSVFSIIMFPSMAFSSLPSDITLAGLQKLVAWWLTVMSYFMKNRMKDPTSSIPRQPKLWLWPILTNFNDIFLQLICAMGLALTSLSWKQW